MDSGDLGAPGQLILVPDKRQEQGNATIQHLKMVVNIVLDLQLIEQPCQVKNVLFHSTSKHIVPEK